MGFMQSILQVFYKGCAVDLNLVIKGKAEKPVYLYINNGKIEIRDAAALWGKSTTDAQWAIREELGDEDLEGRNSLYG